MHGLGTHGLSVPAIRPVYPRHRSVGTIRQLRNKGGDVIDRVQQGEVLLVRRDGRPVAELRPVRARGVPRDLLVSRARNRPPVNPDCLRADLDSVIAPDLDWPE
jgi:prevent-host-death family protein